MLKISSFECVAGKTSVGAGVVVRVHYCCLVDNVVHKAVAFHRAGTHPARTVTARLNWFLCALFDLAVMPSDGSFHIWHTLI